MMYLCVLFVPPLYFLLRRKWIQFVINSFFYGIACVLILTLALIFVAPVFWLIAVCHASFNLRQERTVQHAEFLAAKMAEKMNQAQKQ